MMNHFQIKLANMIKRIEPFDVFTFLSASVIFVVTHLYFFTNHHWTNDDLQFRVFYPVKHLSLGRFANCIAYTSDYLLPIPTFVFTMMVFGLICVFLCKTLEIRNKVTAVLISGTIISFPSLSEMFGYGWLIEGFSLGILFSVLGIFCLFKESSLMRERIIYYVLAVVFIALSLGEYQAYISCALSLVSIKLLMAIMAATKQMLVAAIIRSATAFACGGATYISLVKLSCYITGTKISSYKGLDEMGSFSIMEFPKLIERTYKSFWGFVQGTKFYEINILIRSAYIAVIIFSILFMVKFMIKEGRIRDFLRIILALIILAIFPICMNPVDFLAPQTNATCLQIFGYVFVFILFLKLVDLTSFNLSWCEKIVCFGSVLLMFSIIYNNYLLTNIYYQRLSKYADYSLNMTNRVLMRLEELDDFDIYSSIPKKVMIVPGTPTPYGEQNWWPMFINEQGAKHRFNGFQGGAKYIEVITTQAASQLKFGLGTNFEAASRDEINNILASDDFLSMKAWPDESSVGCIDGIYVVSMVDGLRINKSFDKDDVTLSYESEFNYDPENVWWRVFDNNGNTIISERGRILSFKPESGQYRLLLTVKKGDNTYYYEDELLLD